MNGEILPLIGSQHAPAHLQRWHVGGVWRRAVNLYTDKGEQLTLHDQGRGLTPGGWLLRHRDFTRVSRALQAGRRVDADEEALRIGHLTLRPPQRRCALTLRAHSACLSLPASMLDLPEETGLFGLLSQSIAAPFSSELKQFCHCFSAALQGEIVDWRPWLGKGPGLTPSSDDMLVGMLLAAQMDGALSSKQCEKFFTASGNLFVVTTRVSASYLRYASQGLFGSPLLHFATSLQRGLRITQAVEKLLGVGHTSGADTLLGFWLARQLITKG